MNRKESQTKGVIDLKHKLIGVCKFWAKNKFLLKLFPTSRNGANICYISSQDVEYTKVQNKIKTFFTDNITDDFSFEKQSEQWEEALNDETFLIDLLAANISKN